MATLGAVMATLGRPRADFYRFFDAPKRHRKINVFLPSPKIAPGAPKITLWAPKAPFLMDFCAFLVSFLALFFDVFAKRRKP